VEQSYQDALKMQSGSYSFEDFLNQLRTMRNMGGMSALRNMMPGMSSMINDDMLFRAEREIKSFENIVLAMTPEERSNPEILVPSVCSYVY
jgi:signal recognition particle subunit SRP54